MSWLKAILTLASNLLGYFDRKQLIDAGIAKSENKANKKILRRAKRAKENRDNVDDISDDILLK